MIEFILRWLLELFLEEGSVQAGLLEQAGSEQKPVEGSNKPSGDWETLCQQTGPPTSINYILLVRDAIKISAACIFVAEQFGWSLKAKPPAQPCSHLSGSLQTSEK